jgi:hypothetical protein
LNQVQSVGSRPVLDKLEHVFNHEGSELIRHSGRVEIERGGLSSGLIADAVEGGSRVEVERVHGTLLERELLQLLVDVSGGIAVGVPVVLSPIVPLDAHFGRLIGRCVPDEDDLVDLILLVERLEQHLKRLVAPSALGPHSLEEPAQVVRGAFVSGGLKDFLIGTVVVAVDYDLDFDGSLHLVFLKNLVGALEGSSNDFAGLLKRS